MGWNAIPLSNVQILGQAVASKQAINSKNTNQKRQVEKCRERYLSRCASEKASSTLTLSFAGTACVHKCIPGQIT